MPTTTAPTTAPSPSPSPSPGPPLQLHLQTRCRYVCTELTACLSLPAFAKLYRLKTTFATPSLLSRYTASASAQAPSVPSPDACHITNNNKTTPNTHPAFLSSFSIHHPRFARSSRSLRSLRPLRPLWPRCLPSCHPATRPARNHLKYHVTSPQMALEMEHASDPAGMDARSEVSWAHLAYMTLQEPPSRPTDASTDKWPSSDHPAFAAQPYSIHPALLAASHGSVERYGQVTPPEELSPADEPRRDSFREASIPVEQLRNELGWPDHNQLHISHQASLSQQQQHPPPTSKPPAKRRRTNTNTKPKVQACPPADDAAVKGEPPAESTQPPKRKRGRPKSQPQMVETFTHDGIPVQVSSARQSHLEKNRVAAHKCRQRKKDYVSNLEDRARDFSANNKALKDSVALLRDEVLSLKNEVLRHAGCGFWAVDEYLARCAGDLLGMLPVVPRPGQQGADFDAAVASAATAEPATTMAPEQMDRPTGTETASSRELESPDDLDFDLLHDLGEDREFHEDMEA